MRKLNFLLIIFTGLFLASNAFAYSTVTIQTDAWYEWGRLYNDLTTPGTYKATNTNPYDSSGTPDLIAGVYAANNSPRTEDSFGTARVSSIFFDGDPTDTYYDRATASDEVTMFYSNGNDVKISISGDELYTEGFIARFYMDPDKDFNPVAGTAARGSDNDGNTGPTAYKGSTEGTLVLEMTGHVRYADYDGSGTETEAYELKGEGDFSTGAVQGIIYLDVTDGIWMDEFNTNTWDMSAIDPLTGAVIGGYGYADFRLSTTMFPNIGSSTWNLEGVGTAQGNYVPEPATLTLFGLGLLALAGFRRRKAN